MSLRFRYSGQEIVYNMFNGFHSFDFGLNDHNYITLLYMHINFYFQFQCVQCECVVFTTLNLLAKNLK